MYIKPGSLNGIVKAPASKSFAHRAIICALLSDDNCRITGLDMNNDIQATADCARLLGKLVTCSGSEIYIQSGNLYNKLPLQKNIILNCRESGSTLRFLIPVAAALGISVEFTGEGRLPDRPIGEYEEILEDKNILISSNEGKLPLSISGELASGVFKVPGNVSSQYITGLLLALPILKGDSEIVLTTPLESVPYVDITISVMKDFGVIAERTESGFRVKGNQKYGCKEYQVETDYSQAAFWLSAGILSGCVGVKGLNRDSVQGDKAILDVLKQFKGKIYQKDDIVYAEKAEDAACEKERIIDASNIPDLVPVIAVVAAFTPGKTLICNAERLRIKESDRLTAMHEGLKIIGADVKFKKDGLEILGSEKIVGGHISSYNDHRIAMAMAIAALRTEMGVTIRQYKSVEKSYPMFFNDLVKLGGETDELIMGT